MKRQLLIPASAGAVALLVAAQPALGQASEQSLSFVGAWRQLTGVSHKLKAAEHEVRASKDSVDAVRTLHRPIVSLSAQALKYQKTLSVDLSGVKQGLTSSTSDF